jgi:hypothetical protein
VFHLFLDESGDLGFDFSKPGTTKNFVVTVLLLPTAASKRAMEKAVERTVKGKIRRSKKREPAVELKGSKAVQSIKKYFYKQLSQLDFSVYAIILNKRAVPALVIKSKSRLYHHMTRQLIDHLPLNQAQTRIFITLDRSKGLLDIPDFNRSLLAQLQGTVAPNVPIEIFHADSAATKCLQAVDMMASAIFHKYEWQAMEWYNQFANKIKLERIYEVGSK